MIQVWSLSHPPKMSNSPSRVGVEAMGDLLVHWFLSGTRGGSKPLTASLPPLPQERRKQKWELVTMSEWQGAPEQYRRGFKHVLGFLVLSSKERCTRWAQGPQAASYQECRLNVLSPEEIKATLRMSAGMDTCAWTPQCVLSHFSRVQLFLTLWTVAWQAPLSMGSPGKNPGVGCRALLQGIFLTQWLNPCLMSPALASRFITTSAT